MRPILLEMRAFGSYCEKTIIDFRRARQNFFLISGNTGAGKSTIFDGMCFALYGESNAAKGREGVWFQSQFAGLDVIPEVKFVFEEKGEEYTIIRRPRYLRKVKRKTKDGSLTKEENGSVELLFGDGTSYKERDIQDRINLITGLTKQEFTQTAMIAQGEFMELLREKTKDRQEIFRKLFHTEIYQKISDELSGRNREINKKLAVIGTECKTEISHIEPYFPEGEDREERENFYRELTESFDKSSARIDELITILDEMCKGQTGDCKAVEKQYDKAGEKLKVYRDTLSKSETIAKAYRTKEDSQNVLKELQNNEGAVREQEKILALMETAFEIRPYYDAVKESGERLKNINDDIALINKILPEFKEREKKLSEQLKESKDIFDRAKEEFLSLKAKVEVEINNFCKLEETDKKLRQAVEGENKYKTSIVQLQQSIKTISDEITMLKDERENLKNAEVQLLKARQEERELSDIDKKLNELSRKIKLLGEKEEIIIKAEKDYLDVRRKYNEASENYNNLNEIFLDNQAGIIANTLLEGKPCPVCGSLSHPKKAVLKDNNISEDMVKTALKERDDCNKKQNSQAVSLGDLKKDRENILNIIDNITGELPGDYFENKNGLLDNLVKFKEEHKSNKTQNKKNVNDLSQKKERFDEVEKKIPLAEASLEKVTNDLQLQKDELKEKEKLVVSYNNFIEEIKKQLNYETKDKAEEVLKTKEQLYKKANNICEGLLKDYDEIKHEISDNKGKLNTLLMQAEKEDSDYKEKRLEYEKMLSEGAITQEEMIELTKCTKSEKNQKEKEVQEFWQRKKEAETTIKNLMEIIKDNEKPDIASLKVVMEEQEKEVILLEKQRNSFSYSLDNNKKVLNNLKNKRKAYNELYARHISLARLSNVACGKVSGQNKVDLETFVQRYYLNKVLLAANRRFINMSAGQFELVMKQEEDFGGKSNTGLDLMVHSLVTDSFRDIKTLSGGESFMAALSMALGMADIIQNTRSSVELDMMFIDEGFGSLDDESRNQAIHLLKELAGGRRLIGIISHVSELKNQVEDQLIVEKDGSGSRVRWA